MAGSYYGLRMAEALLSGVLDSTELETMLTTYSQIYKGPFRALLRSGTLVALFENTAAMNALLSSNTSRALLLQDAGPLLAGNTLATKALCTNSIAIKTVVETMDYLNYWQNIPANKIRLQAQINASGSKLLRYVYNTAASGTWTLPSGGIVSMSYCIGGGGGNGGNGTNNGSPGQGGSGAEFKFGTVATGDLPASNQSYTTGAASNNSTFGSLLSALAGINGTTSTSTNTGPGSDSGSACFDTDLQNAIWQPYTGTKKGGNGAAGRGSTQGSGSVGTAGLSGSGGPAGIQTASVNATCGAAGTGYGSGGGSGSKGLGSSSNATSATTSGTRSALGNGNGGGGGSTDTNALNGQSGGAGSPGLIVIHVVQA